MSIPRFLPHLSMFFVGLALSVCLAMGSVAPAQTQASCTFTTFALQSQIATGTRVLFPVGVNDYATVVGVADNSNGLRRGFTRWSNGGLSFYTAKPAGSAVDTFFH